MQMFIEKEIKEKDSQRWCAGEAEEKNPEPLVDLPPMMEELEERNANQKGEASPYPKGETLAKGVRSPENTKVQAQKLFCFCRKAEKPNKLMWAGAQLQQKRRKPNTSQTDCGEGSSKGESL